MSAGPDPVEKRTGYGSAYVRIIRAPRESPFIKQAGKNAIRKLEVVLPSGETIPLAGVMACTLHNPLDGVSHVELLIANFEEVYE